MPPRPAPPAKNAALGNAGVPKVYGSGVSEPERATAISHGPGEGDWLRSGMLFAAKVPVPAVRTPGTGTAEQHGGASPLRRCRPKARESIGMRIRRSGAATCKLPENICTPGNARKKVRKSLANHAVLLPRGAAGMIHPSGLRPPRGGPRAGAAQKRGREPHRTPFVPVIVRGRHLSEQADS